MTTLAAEIRQYLEWMELHIYARTTIEDRRRYLDYFLTFAEGSGVHDPSRVNLSIGGD